MKSKQKNNERGSDQNIAILPNLKGNPKLVIIRQPNSEELLYNKKTEIQINKNKSVFYFF
jgi:hypothetical protein